jgi:hypothetical protein
MHQVGDPVYSNSFGLGYISKIEDTILYRKHHVMWMGEAAGWYADGRWYESKGIDTLKMFLRMKLRGEDI